MMINGIATQGAQFALFGYNSFSECCRALQEYPLFKRITDNWQTTLMVATTALSVITCAVAFFAGSTFLAATSFIVAAGSAIGALCMYHFSDLKSLKETAEEFGLERQRLTTEVQDLRGENETYKNNNTRLEETTNQLRKEMEEQNQTFKKTNDELQETTNGLKNTKTTLETETEKLKAQILVLKESAETIHNQLEQTTQTNTISKENVEEIRAQLKTWKDVQEQIGVQFKDQRTEMGEQLKQLGASVQEIFKQTAVRERYDNLKVYQQDLNTTKDQLNQINMQIGEKTAGLQEIHNVYVKMVAAMEHQVTEIGKANQQHLGLNDNLGTQVGSFKDQIGELTKLIDVIRPYLPPQTTMV